MKIRLASNKRIDLYNILNIGGFRLSQFQKEEGKQLTYFPGLEEDLIPFKEDIELFYDNPVLNLIFVDDKKVRKCADLNEYIEYIRGMDFVERILSAIYLMNKYKNKSGLLVNSETEDEEEILEIRELFSSKRYVDLIGDLDLEDKVRWQLMSILNSNVDTREEFLTFLKRIEPVYRKYSPILKRMVKNEDNALRIMKDIIEKIKNIYPGMEIETLIGEENADKDITLIPTISVYTYLRKVDDELLIAMGMDSIFSVDKLFSDNVDKGVRQSKVFNVLADPSRVHILELIASGNKVVKDIATVLKLSSGTVTHHITKMIDAGIVSPDWRDKGNTEPINIELLKDVFDNFISYLDKGFL